MDTHEALRIAAQIIRKSDLFGDLRDYDRAGIEKFLSLDTSTRESISLEWTPKLDGARVSLYVDFQYGGFKTNEAGDSTYVCKRNVQISWGSRGSSNIFVARDMLDLYTRVVGLAAAIEPALPETTTKILRTKAQLDADAAVHAEADRLHKIEAAKSRTVRLVCKCMRVNGVRSVEPRDLADLKNSGVPFEEYDTVAHSVVVDGKSYELRIGYKCGWAEVRRTA